MRPNRSYMPQPNYHQGMMPQQGRTHFHYPQGQQVPYPPNYNHPQMPYGPQAYGIPQLHGQGRPEAQHQVRPQMQHQAAPQVQQSVKPQMQQQHTPQMQQAVPQVQQPAKPQMQHQDAPQVQEPMPDIQSFQRQLTIEDAIGIARGQVEGKVVQAELEHEGGRQIFEVDIINNQGVKYEVRVDAQTGRVLGVDQD